jgi:hypothetical protein
VTEEPDDFRGSLAGGNPLHEGPLDDQATWSSAAELDQGQPSVGIDPGVNQAQTLGDQGVLGRRAQEMLERAGWEGERRARSGTVERARRRGEEGFDRARARPPLERFGSRPPALRIEVRWIGHDEICVLDE